MTNYTNRNTPHHNQADSDLNPPRTFIDLSEYGFTWRGGWCWEISFDGITFELGPKIGGGWRATSPQLDYVEELFDYGFPALEIREILYNIVRYNAIMEAERVGEKI